MTVFYKSTQFLRRSLAHRYGKRTFAQVSHPVHRMAEGGEVSSYSKLRSKNWTMLVPTTIVILGLGFSTFSARQQIMCCTDTGRLPIGGKKP